MSLNCGTNNPTATVTGSGSGETYSDAVASARYNAELAMNKALKDMYAQDCPDKCSTKTMKPATVTETPPTATFDPNTRKWVAKISMKIVGEIECS